MNILLLMTDQLTVNALSAYGNRAAHTPNLDALAARGVVFENAYCNSPLCVPSRSSMCASQLPFKIRAYDNGAELPASTPTFAHHLRVNGFRTALSGKMHFIGPDQLHGFEERPIADIYPAALDWTPDWSRGIYANPGTSARLKLPRSGPCREPTLEMRYDDAAHARAMALLRSWRAEDRRRPFLLCVSFTHPHDPFIIGEKYWNLYADADIAAPRAPAAAPFHPYNVWINSHHDLDHFQPTDEQVQRSRRAYYGMISYVDEKVGAWMAELERLDLASDTLVLFTSDHGEMLGEHGMWFKRTFYDGCCKVPMIAAGPGARAGARVRTPVSLVDVYPTILNAAGAPLPAEGLDGQSLAPLMARGDDAGRQPVICEYAGEGILAPMRLIRKGDWKFVYPHGMPPLLFNLARDPLERENLYARAECSAVRDELSGAVMAGWDPERLSRDVRRSQRERLLISNALRAGRVLSWDWPDADPIGRP